MVYSPRLAPGNPDKLDYHSEAALRPRSKREVRMLPPFTGGKTAKLSVTTTATSYTFTGNGNQYRIVAASTLAFHGVGSAGITAKAGSAGGGFYQIPLVPGQVNIFTRNPQVDVKLSVKALTTTGIVYITEGSGQ